MWPTWAGGAASTGSRDRGSEAGLLAGGLKRPTRRAPPRPTTTSLSVTWGWTIRRASTSAVKERPR
eukprot:2150864-Alexandrium_andersonii.AAC.1